MKTIKMPILSKYLDRITAGKKNIEFRLADFKIKKGDALILEEWNPKTRLYTGKKITKKVKNVIKFNPLDNYSANKINKFGLLAIEIK